MAYVCNLSPELQKRALVELNEDPERRKQDIEHIRQWLKKQPHIKAKTDDWNILRFLRGCKFSLEKTKAKLDMYYTCRAIVPEWYSKRDPELPVVKSILELGEFLPLPGFDSKGRKVIVIRTGVHDPSKISMDEVFKATNIISDVLLDEEEQLSITGITQIIDLEGVTTGHALQMTPALVKKAMTIWQDAYPARPKGLHYINTPPTFEAVFSIFKSFMKEKMKKRIQIHGNNMESLQNAIGKDVLPIEYGGYNGSVEDIKNYWLKKVISKRDWIIEDEKYKADESKRPGKPKTTSDLFGLDGSFRKLNVD